MAPLPHESFVWHKTPLLKFRTKVVHFEMKSELTFRQKVPTCNI